MTSLYLDQLPALDREFRKVAAFSSRLSEQATNWPQEVTSELYKQLPFLSDYDVNVNLEKVEPQRGFAFGYADVSNKTERPEAEHSDAGLPHVRIPVVVVERGLKPFSIFLDGERVMPLNEDRFREILFQPSTFDLSVSQPRDPSLVEPLMPPQRSGIGMGGEYKMASAKNKAQAQESAAAGGVIGAAAGGAAGYGLTKDYKKLHVRVGRNLHANVHNHPDPRVRKWAQGALKGASRARRGRGALMMAIPAAATGALIGHEVGSAKEKRSSLLSAIASTISERDADAFVEKVANEPTLRAGLSRSGIAPTLVEVFDHTKRASAEDRLSALADRIEPTVITMQKLPGGDFLVKSANVNAASEAGMQGQVVPAQEAAQAIGPANAQAMQPGQTATVTANPVQATPQITTKAKVVDDWGQYKVQDMQGNSLLGHVFPQTLSWGDFQPSAVALFTNGSTYAIQDSIAGELVGKGVTFPSDAPRGDGCFYDIQNGDVVVTAPCTIGSSASGPDGAPRYMATDVFGNQFQLVVVQGLKSPYRISDLEYGIPESWKFMRLNNQTQLIPDPVQMNKSASVREAKNSVTLFFNGAYQLDGGCGIDKLSADLRYDMDAVHAEFMLGLLGVDGIQAKQKVAEARKKGSVKLAGLKPITLLSERYDRAEKTASALLSQMPNLRRDLTKEAAVLEGADEGTVDHILALNFINPENLSTFVSYVPELEQTGERLAEMLLMSYVGQRELPEGAVERAMKNLEEVIQGLKAVAATEGM